MHWSATAAVRSKKRRDLGGRVGGIGKEDRGEEHPSVYERSSVKSMNKRCAQ